MPKGDLQKETELSDKLHEIPQVSSIISYVDSSGAEVPMINTYSCGSIVVENLNSWCS